jgi:8-oxo-dGTP pyrophosphatase MutT (NUDIX family)
VYRNPWLAVREDQVIRPDGAPGIYGVVEMGPSVGIVAINDEDQIALVSQWRYVHGRMSLEIPTGAINPDEDYLIAAKRELVEETGLVAGQWSPLGAVENANGITTDISHLYSARDLTAGPLLQQGDELTELCWEPFDAAVDLVMTGAITCGISVAAILKTQHLRQTQPDTRPGHHPAVATSATGIPTR